jgi:hypothetical protein
MNKSPKINTKAEVESIDFDKCNELNLVKNLSAGELMDSKTIKNLLKPKVKKKESMQSVIIHTIELKKNHSDTTKSTESVWKKFKKKLSTFTNNIKYNTVTLNTFFDYNNFNQIKLFNSVYKTNSESELEQFYDELVNIIYISYRNEFPSIKSSKTNKNYTSDCGWGCMIRSAQMILARGIQKLISQKSIEGMRQTILLFADNPLNYSELKEDELFINVIDNVIESLCEVDVSDEYKSELIKATSSTDYVKFITAPFSIRNICQLGESYNKGPGEWFSDVNCIHIFQQINNQFNPLDNMKILYFPEGVIYNQDIVRDCFEETETKTDEENKLDDSVFNIGDKFYRFKNPFLIFVSFRLGLDKITPEYYDAVKEIFNIPNNLGIIGGRGDSAHYFIGTADNCLLYLDPHLNQKAFNSILELEQSFSTYLHKQVYQLQIKNMSPAFTVGFYARNLYEYIELITQLKYNNISNNSFLKYQEEIKLFEESDEFMNNIENDF